VVDGALIVLANSGQVRVTGDDGKPASLPDLPRQKIGTCTFRSETTIINITQRIAVRGLLADTGIPFENNQEAFALSALLDRLEAAVLQSGQEAPAPEADKVPNLAAYKALSGNDLLAALAANASTLRTKLKDWEASAKKIRDRQPNWHLAERLVGLGATDRKADLENIRAGRRLLADPDPVSTLIAGAADSLRAKLNGAHAAWQAAWDRSEERLINDPAWAKLTADQKHAIRQERGLLLTTKPAVDTPQAIAAALAQRGLSEWENMAKALPTRTDDALADAAALLEPKARTVTLPGALVKSEAELDDWLAKVRAKIAEALANGPVIPKV
jgi:hypothetical protein